jgi:hypothetical protein
LRCKKISICNILIESKKVANRRKANEKNRKMEGVKNCQKGSKIAPVLESPPRRNSNKKYF